MLQGGNDRGTILLRYLCGKKRGDGPWVGLGVADGYGVGGVVERYIKPCDKI